MKNENNPRFPLPGVRAIIQNEKGEILLLKRAAGDNFGGMWCLPGGKVDYGLTVESAIITEIKEETNLDCTEVKFLFYMDGLPVEEYYAHYIIFYFECKVTGEIKLNEESDEYRWVRIEDIDKYEIALSNEKGIRRYLQDSK
ncbi:MAG: NUDIX domain-containing protein [bacterium]